MPLELEAVVPHFEKHRKFLLTTHVNPDGDALGSEIALGEWLSSHGKQVEILNHSTTPANYLFLDPNMRIRTFDPAKDAPSVTAAEVIVVMDANHPSRLRSLEPYITKSKSIKICIDHHPEPSPFAEHYVVDESATSTGELTYRLLSRLGGDTFSPLVAQALYCAIMTDTGSFRYSNVNPETHRMVAHLIERGADPGEIYRRIYEQWTPGRSRLLGEALAGMKIDHEGRLAYVTVTREMLDRTKTKEEDTDNFTAYPMSVAGVLAGILFLELPDGAKMSLRSRGEIPINELAKEFGGNGHKNAAGARLHDMPLATLQARVIQEAEKYLQEERKK
jgi:phosphoesterase RecJ-like protein